MINPAIYFHAEAYSIDGPKLMGRNAAGESFIRGFFKHSRSKEFWIQVERAEHAKSFSDLALNNARPEKINVVTKNNLSALSQPGLIYFPGPGIGEHAFHRSKFGHASWSLCGVTHTTSSAGAMDALVDLITSPVQSWDALICTSNAVKANVASVLQAQIDYLKDRLGITKMVLPHMPVIPLGIHTEDFDFTQDQKNAAKVELGVSPDAIVVLFMGRLSFHAKAHPLAMYQALQKAKLATGKEIVLVECGWYANDSIEKAFDCAAQLACPDVRIIKLDGRLSANRQAVWAGSDIFCSLSDNIQETFGIVPIEAMAAGLPVVVSDWDGYKDTVRDGVDGFRIPTTLPAENLGEDLALRHALGLDTYDMYCGHTCMFVSVDIERTTQAFVQLFESQALRQQMGQAGKTRAQEVYDWSHVIAQYESLWQECTAQRQLNQGLKSSLPHAWPARLNPFFAFAGYSSHTLALDTPLALVDRDVDSALERFKSYRALMMLDFAKHVLPSEDEVKLLFKGFLNSNATPAQVLGQLPSDRQAFVFRCIVWLLKMGLLRVLS
jgi:glycosyltransferase involved in cell wall biosynthesis